MKRLEYLRAFLRFCVEAGWIERNPAAALKPTKVPHIRPALHRGEVERLLDAAGALVGFGQYGPRIEPMILLLRYSGLRMQDAACLERGASRRRQAVPLSAEDGDARLLPACRRSWSRS